MVSLYINNKKYKGTFDLKEPSDNHATGSHASDHRPHMSPHSHPMRVSSNPSSHI